jgi:hypothetical protein
VGETPRWPRRIPRSALRTRCARPKGALAGFDGDVVVLYGDAPLVPSERMAKMFALRADKGGIAVLGFDRDPNRLWAARARCATAARAHRRGQGRHA